MNAAAAYKITTNSRTRLSIFGKILFQYLKFEIALAAKSGNGSVKLVIDVDQEMITQRLREEGFGVYKYRGSTTLFIISWEART